MSAPFLTDFSDRISPMLVKELRQGLRAKTFVALFLSLQVFLAVMLFSASAASNSDQIGSVISSLIFTFFSVAVLLVQPLRGISALSSEVKGNTIDMMVLTRLSALRIVFGKWVAIVSQSALLLSTIIPYLILRYFFGGMNLFAEIVALAMLFVTSLALTAVTVGLSGCTSVIVRSLIPIFGLPVLWISITSFLFRGFGRSGGVMDIFSLTSTDSQLAVTLYLATMVYVGGSMLSLGASLIAPAAENHAFLRRLTALVSLLVVFILGFFEQINKEPLIAAVFIIAIPAIMIALNDAAPLVLTICKPFVKKRRVGRIIGWLFYPNWGSGIIYATLIGLFSIAIILMPLSRNGSLNIDADDAAVFASLFGGLFFPAVWQVFFFRGEGQRIGHYLLILAGSLILLGILTMLSEAMHSGLFLWAFAWNPLAFLPMLSHNDIPDDVILIGAVIVDAVLLIILLVKAVQEIRKTRPIIEETITSLHDEI
ncbi:MAG: hypothetical protein H8M99_14975 [Gloeobacteraceae cyanobacterium ES-bin-144]|nr:hypothetical protein [Verrucomicrobiales bacterium]